MIYYTCADFPYDLMKYVPKSKGKQGARKDRRKYAEIIATFDIETTALDDIQQAVLWHWQTCIDGMIVTGRTWNEYQQFLDGLDQWLPAGYTLVFYVHNLAYEFQFLRAIHDFTEEEVFCVTGRKVVKASINNRFEYRCSYFLTNMSLREFLKKMNIEHKKTDLDYHKKRFPWTPITQEEFEYCVNDVLGLYEALKKTMKIDGHTIATIPVSSTGYVRADFKKAMRDGGFINMVQECAPSFDVYLAIRRAFRGGNTHANRCYTGVIMPNVHSYDRASSYPDVLVNYPYPVKPFKRQRISKMSEIEPDMPYLLNIEFSNIRLRDPFCGCPYIPIHKCQILVGSVNDNGRVIQAERLSMYMTDIDLKILTSMYVFDSAVIIDSWRSEYGMLPSAMRDVTMEYYRKKTELKGVAGQEVYYTKAKNKLNSIYGMCATNPVRTTIVFNGHDFAVKDEDPEDELKKANRKAFTVFCWGCWCTAYARLLLQRAIDLCGHKFIYCDTDSVKYVGDVDFTALNDELTKLSERNAAYADDPAGVRHYLGVYEHDAEYQRFVTLGAKKYAYEDENGQFHITIAGVSKSGAAEMQCIENFREGFIFKDSAGVEAWYNDDWHDPVTIDGHTIEVPPNIYLKQSTYVLGLTLEYKKLFHLTQEQYDKIMKTM